MLLRELSHRRALESLERVMVVLRGFFRLRPCVYNPPCKYTRSSGPWCDPHIVPWDRFAETRRLTRGQLPIAELPKGISGARIALSFGAQTGIDIASGPSKFLPWEDAC